jgi:hypothetical protein
MAHADNLGQAVPSDPSLAYRVSQGGTYYVKVSTPMAGLVQYQLDLRPIGLNNALTDPTWLNKSGGAIDVWLSGGVLDVAGPVGHGFGVRGNWQQTVTGSGATAASTYHATGTLYLETALGELAMPLPGGMTFTVTAKPGQWGQDFGELNQISGATSLSLIGLLNYFNKPIGLGLSATLPQLSWGVALGGDLTATGAAMKGAPLDAAIPYLYYSFSTGSSVSLSFGGIKASAKLGPGVPRPGINLAADPADPFLYVGVSGLNPIPSFAVGYSREGLIPFTPKAMPAHYQGQITGNVYLNISGISLTDAGVPLPVSLSGDLTINTDPNHTGKFLGGAFGNVSDLVAALHQSPAALGADVLHRLDVAFQNMDIGQNGTISLGVDLKKAFGIDTKVFSLSLPAFQETFIWDGPAEKMCFDGTVPDPLKNTVLDKFVNGQARLDAYFSLKDRQFEVKVTGQADLLGNQGSAVIDVTNEGVNVDAVLSLLGNNHVELKGNVDARGDLNLSAQAQVNLLNVVSASATFTLTEQGGVYDVGADLHTQVEVPYVIFTRCRAR